ncbi:MAG: hypothetical protein ACTTKZ_01200 [Bacteroides sp.]
MAFNNLQEEELKNRIGDAFFAKFDCDTRIGKIDFCITQKQKAKQGRADTLSLLWAEAKRGVVADIYKPLVQLILTIGKARTFDSYLPPPFLAAFDAEKIAFLPYKEILPFFSLNDFNWNVAPSDDATREFGLLYDAVKSTIDRSAYIFRYDSHEKELREFIRVHLSENSELIQINKNNFVSIYQRWLVQVQPSIEAEWELLKKNNIIDGDFFLADLLSENNQSIKEALFVLLLDNRYIVDRRINALGLITSSEVFFKDQQKAHAQFWSIYQRPPKEEYWDYIINRRDLLVPQDVRERKGSFFTPKIWVDLSQKYLADVLGENWQDEYYVWDCAAGTGNLLNGLTNKYHIWASTLDQQDVDVMTDRIKNGANLLESHVFQFDFLNDEFTKLPQPLQDIINDEEKRKKLVIYINPPYAEAGNTKVINDSSITHKDGVSVQHSTYKRFLPYIGIAGRELFAQFIIRIYTDISSCTIAQFSKLKIVQAPNFKAFRAAFRASLLRSFIVPANTFDNVNGEFPIGFFIWKSGEECFEQATAEVYNNEGMIVGTKVLAPHDNRLSINDWIIRTRNREGKRIGYMSSRSHDFSGIGYNYIKNSKEQVKSPRGTWVTDKNLSEIAIFLVVCHVIQHTWLNDRDQFLYPKDGWEKDDVFRNNCLAALLFHTQNYIQRSYDINHWIPFTEQEVNAKEEFESHFMTDFILGKLGTQKSEADCLLPQEQQSFIPTEPLVFSPEAAAVFDAGRELWRYYHAQPNANPNASYYDIRAHFQGRNDKGKMNPKSEDKEYMRLLGNLKEAMEVLRLKIVPKVYEYGFLIE